MLSVIPVVLFFRLDMKLEKKISWLISTMDKRLHLSILRRVDVIFNLALKEHPILKM